MLRFRAHLHTIVIGTILVSSVLAFAQQGPVAAMYADDQQRGKAITLGFTTATLPATAAAPAGQIYLTTGDLQRAFDEARFRPDGAIVPTNTGLQLTAKSPATQRVLVDRVQKQPDAFRALQEQIETRRGGPPGSGGLLEIGVDTFFARLSRDGSGSAGAFPATVCFIATDFPDGGAIDRRELFAQDRLRKGVAGCLTALDAAGVRSAVIPLVGAASSGTQSNDPQYEGQRVLMECRLINAVAGIGLGIADFGASRKNLRELGIIQWEQEILPMFAVTRGSDMSRAAQTAYRVYTSQLKQALRNGLAGRKTTSSDVSGGCTEILRAK